jgi:hypothetical protein
MSPPNTTQLLHQEGRIALAIEAFNQGYFTSIRAAARSYDIPRSTLQDCINKHPVRCDLRPANCKLTETEESTLVQWILSIDERGLLPRSDTVQQIANLLLQKRSRNQGDPLTVSKLWVYNLVQQYSVLKSRYNRKYDYQQAKYKDLTIIRDWFRLVQNTIEKYRILEDDIYNFNETGFQIGVILIAKVITRAERARPVLIQPGNQEWVTVIDCISLYR